MQIALQLGILVLAWSIGGPVTSDSPQTDDQRPPRETYDQPPAPPPAVVETSPPGGRFRGYPDSMQVNIDEHGDNIVGDAANEPSIAVDPNDPRRLAIGWRQFDSVRSNYREAGVAFSRDAGRTWTAFTLKDGEFRTDPVLDSDRDGNFYYYSLYGQDLVNCDLFKSGDGGKTWSEPVPAYGGDKNWMIVDRTDSTGQNHVYCDWREDFSCCGRNIFTRSTDQAESFEDPVPISQSPAFGTMAVGPEGELYVAGVRLSDYGAFRVAKSSNARDRDQTPKFESAVSVNMGGRLVFNGSGPNPAGLLGQVWVATDISDGPTRGNVYLLCSVDPSGRDPLDIHFSRSTDGGKTWSSAVRVNDDSTSTRAYQWFGTMSVAPNGRIDAIWNDTRDDDNPPNPKTSRVYYAYSTDAGDTWSASEPLTPAWNHSKGYPQQNKIGDYYHMVSDNVGANLAYAATFNEEQDVYFMRIGDYDCNGNAVGDSDDIAGGDSTDLNQNGIPDECDGLGDLNCDDDVSFNDIDPFVLALTDPESYQVAYPECDILRADTDGDGAITLDDIDPFVTLLTK
jgi:hypothetical protein